MIIQFYPPMADLYAYGVLYKTSNTDLLLLYNKLPLLLSYQMRLQNFKLYFVDIRIMEA